MKIPCFTSEDVYDVFRVWGPADLVCFSVPLWLRLPVRHVWSLSWGMGISSVAVRRV